MLQPLATPSHTSPQWTVTNPTLVAPRPLRYPTLVAPHPLRPAAHYHPYQPPRHTRVPPRLRVVPSPAEALARISLIDHPTPPPELPDESGPQKYGTVSTLSSETLEEFLRILRNGGGVASPVETPETQPVITDCVTSPEAAPLASAPAVWDRRDVSRTPDAPVPSTAPILPAPEWVGRSAHASSCVIRKRTRTQSQSPTRDHDRWSHPYRRDACSRGSEKSNKRGNSFCEPTLIRPSPRRSASKRASASSWSSETDVSEPADLGSSQNEDVDVELASNRGDVDDEELLTRSADTELDSSTCEDAPKTHSVRGRMSCTPASPISRKHTSNPLAHYSPMLFETLAARARANAFSPSHSRSPSPTPAPHIPDPLDDEEDGDLDEYQPESVVRMEMPRSSQSPPSTP